MAISDKEKKKRWQERWAGLRPEGVCTRFPGCHRATDGIHKLCDGHRAYSVAKKAQRKLLPKPDGECQVIECKNKARPGLTRCERCAVRDSAWYKTPPAKRMRLGQRQASKSAAQAAYGGACRCCGLTDAAFLTLDHVSRYDGTGPRGGHPLYLWAKANGYPPSLRVLCLNCNFALGKFGYCPHGDLTQPLAERPVLARTLDLRAYGKARNHEFKLRVFNAYGGVQCACCGESNHEYLTLDHVNNDGAAHRKELNGKPIYHWLCRNGFPPGFQVLCMNCNRSKHDYGGVCWHKGGVRAGGQRVD